jgi:hypothetical protein
VRNGFIFFAIALAFLMLPFSVRLTEIPDTIHIIVGLFLSGGTVYLLSYLYYDRAEPRLGETGLRMMRTFLLVAATSFAVGIISVVLHNFVGALLGTEEPVFFFISLISAVAFAVGITGSLAIFIKGLCGRVM